MLLLNTLSYIEVTRCAGDVDAVDHVVFIPEVLMLI